VDQLLWFLLAGTRGGLNRMRILEALKERPYNAHQLAELLHLDYRTMRHHLDLLVENNVLARPSGDAYGALYFVSGLMKGHWATFDEIRAHLRPNPGSIVAKGHKKEGTKED
jgi:DNA-binding transcriptional ArsR family regulator